MEDFFKGSLSLPMRFQVRRVAEMVALRKAKPMEILKKSMPSAEHSVPLMPVTGTDALRPVPDSVLIPSGSPFINPFSGNRPK